MLTRGFLLGIAAAPIALAGDSRNVVQVSIVANEDILPVPSYPQYAVANSTMASATTISIPTKSNTTTTSTPSPVATAAADLPSPSLDKSIFSLIVFGIAGLCLI